MVGRLDERKRLTKTKVYPALESRIDGSSSADTGMVVVQEKELKGLLSIGLTQLLLAEKHFNDAIKMFLGQK